MGQIAIVDTARLLTKDLIKTFACEVCGKVFKHPDSLRQHHKAHTGETKCPVCYMVMSRKYELRVHLRKRHNIIQWYQFAVFTDWLTCKAPTGPNENPYTTCAPVIILFTVIHRESQVSYRWGKISWHCIHIWIIIFGYIVRITFTFWNVILMTNYFAYGMNIAVKVYNQTSLYT